MKPIYFDEANKVLTAPDGMSKEACVDLCVVNDGNQSISCWELNDEERRAIAEGANIWLGVLAGATQPPVWLSTERPFKVEYQENTNPSKSTE